MSQKLLRYLGCAVILFAMTLTGLTHAYDRPERKPAIVLAAFGTSQPEALEAILNIEEMVKKAFPDYDVHLAFTSNIIRHIWHERADDAEFKSENPDVPEEMYSIANVLTTLANIQEGGARLVLVQSLHVTDGEEYTDLANLVKALSGYQTMKASLHPFPWIGVGEPALGLEDGLEKSLERAAVALGPIARKAWETSSSLVFMGHGNEHLNQEVFAKLETILRKKYGEHIYIGTVEAEPFAEEIAEAMKAKANSPKNIFLAPLMVVAGDHAKNDMAGDEEDSWTSIFQAQGFTVEPYLVGLGSLNDWAEIYVEHLKALEPTVVAQKARDEVNEAE